MRPAIFAALAFALGCAPAAWADENSKPVKAADLRPFFAEHELGDGVHYAYQFHADGTFSGTEMGKDVRGKWRFSAREMCWTWIQPPGAEECYVVRKKGAEVSLLKNGMEEWYGTLKPIQSRRP
jgi:hypothetical protein